MIGLAAQEIVRGLVYVTGATLYSQCVNPAAEPQAACMSYIMGAIDLEAIGEGVGRLPPTLCLPENVPPARLRDIVVAYYRANPDKRQYSAAGVVVTALAVEYPCAKA